MKKEDIDPKLFKMLPTNFQNATFGGIQSLHFLDTCPSIFESNLTAQQKEHILNLIISEFPKNCNSQDFAEWRHIVGINNHFHYILEEHDSENHLLNSKNIDFGLKLADFIAKKTLEIGDRQSAHSIGAVVEGFMMYNWDQLRKNGFDTPLVMPETFRKPEFFDLVYAEGKDINKTEIQSLFQSKTACDWVKKCAGMNPEKKGTLTPFTRSEWNKIFEKYPWLEGKNYVLPSDCDESIQRMENFQKMLKETPKGKVGGIFVDIDGTLIDGYNGALNEKLYGLLVELSKHENITIFTGGNVKKQTERLRDLLAKYAAAGVIEKENIDKFPIVSKEDYRGFLFTGFIIDDIPPERQGFIVADKKHRYIGNPLDLNSSSEELKEKINKGETFENFLEELALTNHLIKISKRATRTKSYDARFESMGMGYEEIFYRSEEGIDAAVKAHKLRYPSLSQRLKGAQSDRKAALEVIKKYHEAHPKQKTALKFKPSKKSEHE